MQAGVNKILSKCGYGHIRSNDEYIYARDTSTVSLINIETGHKDYIPERKIKAFWDNLAEDDKIEMASWTYEQFLERLNKAYCYYLKRGNKIIAIGGTYPNDLNICLWLLVTKQAGKYPLTLIKAVRKGIMKELKGYPECMQTVLALPDGAAFGHRFFIERVLEMNWLGYEDTKAVYMKDRQELLECVG